MYLQMSCKFMWLIPRMRGFFPRVCWHVAFKMTFVVKALSHWLQLLQRMYFQISWKFIWLISRKCFEMQFKFIILWKNPFYIGCIAMVFPQCVSSCGVLYCSVLPQKSAFTSQQGEIPNDHSSQLFIYILAYCQK